MNPSQDLCNRADYRMNGVQLANSALEIRASLPILLTTAYAEFPHRPELDLPIIAKPYLQQQLADEIAKVLKMNSPHL